jgi:hypothetical protein
MRSSRPEVTIAPSSRSSLGMSAMSVRSTPLHAQFPLRGNVRMNHISYVSGFSSYHPAHTSTDRLDSIGIAGFSHDFGSLDGKKTSVTEVFDAFGHSSSAINVVLLLLSQAFPFITRIPTSRSKLIRRLNATIGEISAVLLDRTRKEKELGIADEKGDHSIIGLLSECQYIQTKLLFSFEISQGRKQGR